MSTATAEKIAEATAAASDQVFHSFNEQGVCLEPEIIRVGMPKGCTCELRLAHAATGGWRVGYQLSAGEDALTVPPVLNDEAHGDHFTALGAALGAALQFFQASPKSKLHKRCAILVETKARLLTDGTLVIGSPVIAGKQHKFIDTSLPEPQNLDLDVARLEANPHNPRGEISEADVAELAETIRAQGLLQPIGVRVIPGPAGLPGDNRLELLWGHRRLAAFRALKRETIACRVYEGISDEQARLVISIENDERKDLDPIKRAKGYADMMRDFAFTQDDVAGALKKSRPVIANALRLLDLPAGVQELLAQGKLTTRHGTALCRFKDWPAACEKIAALTVKDGTAAGELEKGIPFVDELADAKVLVRAGWQWEPTTAQRKDAAFVKDGYNWVCFDEAKWKESQKARAAKTREENKVRAAKQPKTQQAKAYVARDVDVVVDDRQKYLLALIPSGKQLMGRRNKWDSNNSSIVTDKGLWGKLVARHDEILKADANAKLAPIFKKAWKQAEGIKKIDNWAVALLVAGNTTLEPKDFSGDVATLFKLSLAKHAKIVFLKAENSWTPPAIKLNAFAAVDGIEVVKLIAGESVANLENTFKKNGHMNGSDEAWLGFLAGGMDRAEFGLITQEEILAQLKAEFPLTTAPAKAKKGGKKK